MRHVLIASHAQDALARRLAHDLQLPLICPQETCFDDSELRIMFDDQSLADHAIIVHSSCNPVQDNLMWLILTVHALKNHKVKRISAVVPYFGYSRQLENPDGTRGAAYPVISMLERSGIDQIIMVELHDPELADLFAIPARNIRLDDLIARHIKEQYKDTDYALVAPDEGAYARVQAMANVLKKPVLRFKKHRTNEAGIEIFGAEEAFRQGHVIIIDDIIDTGTTIEKVAKMLQTTYASTTIDVFGVHAVLSGAASSRLQQSVISNIWVTNTIQLSDDKLFEKLNVIDISSELVQPLHEILIDD